MIGRTIAHYEVLAKLGEGGMGVVYRAHDTALDRPVALKVISQVDVSEELAGRFALEARAAAAINHPCVCTIYSVDEHEGRRFIAMELVEGETLRRRLREGKLPLGTAIKYTTQVAEGLAAAHARGVVHRDVKPENLIVTPDDRIKITDFGLAKLKGGPGLTKADSTVGTIRYMAPEQIRGGGIDHRVDIWALGVVLYEMLAGRPPFQGDNEAEILYGILNKAPAPVAGHRPEVPAPLQMLLGRMLEKDPGARTADLAEVLAAIHQQHDEPTRVSVPVALPDVAESSVAVLEFTNLTGDAESDWLGSGIAETVTVDLKKASSLQVVSRERVLQALGASGEERLDKRQVIALGQKLNVRWIVWGAFQKLGDAVRITSHFTDVRSGELAGSSKIDGSMDQIFELQDRIIRELLDILDVDIESSELERMKAPHTDQPTAYEAYARGRQELWRFTPESLAKARRHFEKALEIDPGYALAHSGLGASQMFLFIARADPAVLEAGIANLKRAIEIDPRLAEPHHWLSYAYARTQQYREGISHGERAVELEPESYFSHYFLAANHVCLAMREHRLEHLELAVRHFRASMKNEPNYEWNYFFLAWLSMLHGAYREARAYLDRALELDRREEFKGPRCVSIYPLAGFLELRAGERKRSREGFERALEVLAGIEHVYRVTSMAAARVGLAALSAEREEHADALAHLEAARMALEENPAALGGGCYLVLVGCHEAKVLLQSGAKSEAEEALARATGLFEERQGYDFSHIWLGTDAELLYELASYQALALRPERMEACLTRAVDCGFRDLRLLERDEAFRHHRGGPELARVAERLRAIEPPPLLLEPTP